MQKFNQFYDTKLIAKYLSILVGFVLLCKFSGGYAFPLLVPVSLYFVTSRKFEPLFYLLLIAVMTLVTNGYFIPKPFIYAATQRGLMVMLGFFMLTWVFGQRNSPQVGPVRNFLWYIIYIAFVSFTGWSPLISGLKLFLFFFAFMALYSGANAVSTQQHGMRQLRSMILSLMIFLILGSILLIPFPSIGNMSFDELQGIVVGNVSLFKGMTWHSQSLGPMVAFCAIILFGDLVFSIQKADKLYILLLLCSVILLIKTSSRTAMGTFLAGVLFIVWCTAKTRSIKSSWKSKMIQFFLLAGIALSVGILALPSAREKAVKFVVKYGEEGEKVQLDKKSILKSRQGKLDEAMYNWRQSPIVGNGFQVSADMQGFKANSIKDILTAPVEKSTWTYAILEEGGIVGMIIFCLGALLALHGLLSHKAYIGASCFFAMIVVNLGEFTMFSMSGVGGFIWGMVFVACAMDAKRLRSTSFGLHPSPSPNLGN